MAETIISKFVSLIQTKVDPKSVQQTQATLKSVRSFAAKTLGVLGIGFSLSWLKNITEEFKGANDQIRGATEGLGEQAEIQKKILAAANSCRESYSDMAGYVTSLTSNSSKIFPVDDATRFASIMAKLEKASGKSGDMNATMTAMTKMASTGNIDKTSFASLSPEVLSVLEKSLGKSKKQLESMAAAGTLTAKTIKSAFFAAEEDIQKKFNNLDLKITDATKHIRNSWGFWLEDLDSTFKVTDKIARFMIDMSDKLMSKAQKITGWLKILGDKLEGTDKVLKLIAFSAAAIFLAMNAQKITAFLLTAVNFLKSFNIQTALAAAKWLLLFLVLEDIWTFFQGGDSVFGRMLKSMGVDTDKLREKVTDFFEKIPVFFSKLKKFIGEHSQEILLLIGLFGTVYVCIFKIVPLLEKLAKGGALVSKALSLVGISPKLLLIIGLIALLTAAVYDFWNFLHGKDSLISKALESLGIDSDKLRENILGFIDAAKEKAAAFKDWLDGVFDWFGEKIEWAKGLWDGIKGGWDKVVNFVTGKNPDDPKPMGGGSTSTGNGVGRKGVSDFIAGGQGVSGKAAATPVSSNTTNNTTIKQENNQQYTFHVSERDAADKLQREAYAQGNNSAIQLSHALNYGR